MSICVSVFHIFRQAKTHLNSFQSPSLCYWDPIVHVWCLTVKAWGLQSLWDHLWTIKGKKIKSRLKLWTDPRLVLEMPDQKYISQFRQKPQSWTPKSHRYKNYLELQHQRPKTHQPSPKNSSTNSSYPLLSELVALTTLANTERLAEKCKGRNERGESEHERQSVAWDLVSRVSFCKWEQRNLEARLNQ